MQYILRNLPLRSITAGISLMHVYAGAAWPADISVREITEALSNVRHGSSIDLSRRDLSFLDLGNLDLRAAVLNGANFYGADLTAADLRQTDLSNSLLDRATIVRADFSDANLTNARIRLPQSAGSPHFDKPAAPRFTGTNLTRVRLVARLDGADFRHANLVHADLSAYGDTTQNTVASRSELIACDFSGADLSHANLSHAVLRFTRFNGAVLAYANLTHADFAGADLSGTNLTGANISNANFEGAKLDGVLGLEQTRGVNQAIGLAVRPRGQR